MSGRRKNKEKKRRKVNQKLAGEQKKENSPRMEDSFNYLSKLTENRWPGQDIYREGKEQQYGGRPAICMPASISHQLRGRGYLKDLQTKRHLAQVDQQIAYQAKPTLSWKKMIFFKNLGHHLQDQPLAKTGFIPLEQCFYRFERK